MLLSKFLVSHLFWWKYVILKYCASSYTFYPYLSFILVLKFIYLFEWYSFFSKQRNWYLIFVLAEEVPFYAAADERIIEVQGETLKVLKALEAVVSHLRKFLVDHSVLPLFEKTVSLNPADVFCVFISLHRCVLIIEWCICSILHQFLKNANRIPGLTSRCFIVQLKPEVALIILSQLCGNLCFSTVRRNWSHNSLHLDFPFMDKRLLFLHFVLQDLAVLVLL